MLNAMPKGKCKTLGDINDILIVRKITEQECIGIPSKESFEEEEFESDIDRVQHLLDEDQEKIIRKQRQLLEADERGKQALISEIASIKQKQEKRAELLRYRQHALNIEKERAKKIALLPYPLPKSVKSLLRKHDEPKPNKPDVQMPDELKVFPITGVESQTEDKENILDPKELEARKKLQEEWQMKAKKRYNEALKEDRKKEEYSKIMKQIQNSELHNRLEMAKSISSEKKCVSCPLSDKFQTVKKQTDMEDAAEKVFKKINKEHVIEDIEGYQDYYEEKYKKMDSEFEDKMIDCVPSFLKENYEYLLKDETKFQGGKNFKGLDDTSNELLNEAFIASPPNADTLDGSKKIDLAIDKLDKIRSHIQTEYDQTLKPLLKALDNPKKELSDKAVETESIKLPIEDKAVGTDMQYDVKVTSPPSTIPAWTDFSKTGVMASKRRYNVPMLGSFSRMYVPDMHKKEVYYTRPLVSQSDVLTPSSWSSSSYCSLPSQHGMPVISGATDLAKCDICEAERKRDNLPHEVPQSSVLFTKEKCDKSETTIQKYVQQLAEKYSLAKSTSSQSTKEDIKKSGQEDSSSPMYSDIETVNSAFEREILSKPKEFITSQKSDKFQPIPRKEKLDVHHGIYEDSKKTDSLLTVEDKIPIVNPKETLTKQSNITEEIEEHECDDIYDKIKQFSSAESSPECSEYDIEAKRIQLIKQVLSKKIPRFSLDLSSKTEDSFEAPNNEKEVKTNLPEQNIITVEPHVYHDLSTIQEIDSALFASGLQASISKLSDISVTKDGKEPISKISKNDLDLSEDKLKMVSLLDPPDTSISELAKSIQFVRTQEQPVQSLKTPDSGKSDSVEAASPFSKDTLMPSSLESDSNLDTASSVSATGKMFTSSLVENAKHPTIKDNKLPKYFMNVSEIPKKVSSLESYSLNPSMFPSEFHSNVFSSPISCLSIPSSVEEISDKKKDPGHSLISGFSESVASHGIQPVQHGAKVQLKEDKDTIISGFLDSPVPISTQFTNSETSDIGISKHFRVMTPHSNISSPGSKIDTAGQPSVTTRKGDFVYEKHRNYAKQIESKGDHTLISGYLQTSSSNSSGEFQVMTPHTIISSPSERFNFTSKTNYGGYSSSSGEFQVMTPHTIISSPSERFNFTSKTNYGGYSSSSGTFKALTAMSMVSSPSLPGEEVELKSKDSSSGSSEFQPMNIRFDILTSSISSNPIEKLPHMGYHISLKSPVPGCSKYIKSLENSKEKAQSLVQESDSYEKKICYLSQSHGSKHIQDRVSGEIGAKERVKVCSSEFFVPQLCAIDLPVSVDENKLEDNVFSEKINASQPKSTIHSSKASSSKDACHTSEYEEKIPQLKTGPEKESSAEKDKDNLKVIKNVNKYQKQSSLSAVSSTSSSTENLSDISSSKVLYQSTPIKSFEEIAKEPGILEEPDLTLITSEYSCKFDSPEKPRKASSSKNTEPFLSEKMDCTVISSENYCKTPTNQSPQLLASADTPSMISFLQHEISCAQIDNSSGNISPAAIENPRLASDVHENKTGRQRIQFPRSEYKQRTKRLWNNLEEVKKKNLAEERRKLMAANRLKAKEFAKKLTPRKN